MPREIYSIPLGPLANSVVDISTVAKPGHYRLIDCSHYVQHQCLRIHELEGPIGATSYSAISYVWRGNAFSAATSPRDLGAFAVKGAENGDPIGISVLHHACTASLKQGAQYLWLDRLCIMQTSKADKAWQITHMYDIYLACAVCLVVPGGIRRLAAQDERTAWIERAWTLQEAMAPQRAAAVVLFGWEHGSGSWQGFGGAVKGTVTEVVARESAVVPLREMLEACAHPEALEWTSEDGSTTRDDVSADIMSTLSDDWGVLPGSLSRGMDAVHPQARAHAMWQNVYWRASSRPVDMVLSIMGIFGVALDPRAFEPHDRVGATIALAKEILRRGGKPTWLVMAYDVPPSRFLSSFPEFPATDVTGTVDFPTATEDQMFDLTLWWVDDLPDASMDDDGYVTLSSKSAPVVDTGEVVEIRTFSSMQNDDLGADESCVRVAARDGKIWQTLQNSDSHLAEMHSAFIVFLGHARDYPRADTSASNSGPFKLPRQSSLRAIIVEQHAPGKFHRSGAVTLGECFDPVIARNWHQLCFSIGGPDPLPPGTFRGDALLRT